jgi:predicted GNAT family N-acyltransferase
MDLKIIQHGTKEYDQMVQLRLDVLRTPLGLTFTKEQLEKEKDDILINAYVNNELVGCCVLTPQGSSTIQLRQMAVKTGSQSSGAGRKILEFAEQVALQKGYSLLMMHARNVALGFYQKCGYTVKGEEFMEVTIPHRYMEKVLRPA